MTHRFTSCLLAASLLLTPSIASAQTAVSNTAPAAPAAPAAPTAPAVTAPAEPTAPVAPSERPSTYTIEQGDSLWTIAHKFGTTVVKLRKANNLKKGALLHPGQVLQIPPATDK